MRYCLALCGAAALFFSPVLLRGQEQQQPPQRPTVQVGVPDGRGGAKSQATTRPVAALAGAGSAKDQREPGAPGSFDVVLNIRHVPSRESA